MRQEVQSACCKAQPGPAAVVGEFPAAPGESAGVPSGSDSAAPHGEIQSDGGDSGTGRVVDESRVAPGGRGGIAARMLIAIIRVYQWTLSPLLPNCCRFEPTCSRYAVEALRLHGFWRGSWLTCRRLLRCQPFCRGGFDPVPPPAGSRCPAVADAPENPGENKRQ